MDPHAHIDPSLADRCFTRFLTADSAEALAEAFALTAPELLRTAESLAADPHDAADLVQATFLAAIESRARFRTGERLLPWLIGILHNLHRYWSRRRARAIDPGLLAQPPSSDPAILADRKLLRETVDRAIDGLPDRYREVVALHLREGLAPEQIARSLRRTDSTTRSHLWRGLRLLRLRLPPGLVPAATVWLAVRSAQAGRHTPWHAGRPDTGHAARDGARTMDRGRHARRMAGVAAGAIPLVFVLAGLAVWRSARDSARAGPVLPAAAGGTPAAPPVSLAAGGHATASGARLPVIPAPSPGGSGTVRAQLTWSDSGAPAARQSVRVYSRSSGTLLQAWFDRVREGRTDEHGSVEFTDVPGGPTCLLFDDAFARSSEFNVVANRVTWRSERLVSQCEVRGNVLDLTGRPVAGAQIWLSSTAGRGSPGYVAGCSDPDGGFVVRALWSEWRVWATSPDGRSAACFDYYNVRIARPRLVLVEAKASLHGTVRGPEGRPVPGATVGLFALDHLHAGIDGVLPPLYAHAGETGTFRIGELTTGRYLVAARGPGCCPQLVAVSVSGESSTDLTLALGRGGRLTGRVTGRRGVDSTSIAAQPRVPDVATGILGLLAANATVGADGSYVLEHVMPGISDIVIDRDLLSPDSAGSGPWVHLADGQQLTLDVNTGGADEIHGHVVDETGAPCAGLLVSALPVAFDWDHVRRDFRCALTDGRGAFRVPALAGVAYRCFVEEADVHGDRGTFPLSLAQVLYAGERDAWFLVPASQRARCSVRGRLTTNDDAHTGILDLELIQLPFRRRLRVAVDEATGRFEVPRLPPGDYLLVTVRHWERYERLAAFTLGPGEQRDLGLHHLPRTGRLRVSWRRTDGRPAHPSRYLVIRTQIGGFEALHVPDLSQGEVTANLAVDDYELELNGADFATTRQRFSIQDGVETTLGLQLRPAVTCALQFPTARPEVRTGRMWLEVLEARGGAKQFDDALAIPDDGVFRLMLGLEPGAYLVRAVTVQGQRAEGELDVSGAQAGTIDVRLPLR